MTARRSAANEDWEVAFTQLDGRVSSLETAIIDVGTAVKGLGAKLEERGRTQWPALAFALSFVVTVGGLVYYPVVQTQQRVEGSITKLGEMAVSKEDFLLITNAAKERRDDAQRVTESRFARLEKDMDTTQAQIVSRGELQEKWDAQRQHDQDMQRQLDDQRAQMRDLYSPHDALANLQRQVEDLTRRESLREGSVVR